MVLRHAINRGQIMNIHKFFSAELEDLALIEKQLGEQSRKALVKLSRTPKSETKEIKAIQDAYKQINQEAVIIREIIRMKEKHASTQEALEAFITESESLLSTLKSQEDEITQLRDTVREMSTVLTEQQELIDSLSREHTGKQDKVNSLVSSGKSLTHAHRDEDNGSYVSRAINTLLGIFIPFEIDTDDSCTSMDERKLHRLCSIMTEHKFPNFDAKYFDAFMLSICFRLGIAVSDGDDEVMMPEDLSPREISHLSKLAQLMIMHGALNNLPTISSCEGYDDLVSNLELEIYSMSDGTIFGDILTEKTDCSYSLYENVLKGDNLSVVIHEKEEERPEANLRAKAKL